MMTVKIITLQPDGSDGTHLFPASRVSHYEYRLNDGKHPDDTFDTLCQRDEPSFVVTGLNNPNTSQNMFYSRILLYGDNDNISPLLVSAPATVYIMSEGKTIDQFNLHFID